MCGCGERVDTMELEGSHNAKMCDSKAPFILYGGVIDQLQPMKPFHRNLSQIHKRQQDPPLHLPLRNQIPSPLPPHIVFPLSKTRVSQIPRTPSPPLLLHHPPTSIPLHRPPPSILLTTQSQSQTHPPYPQRINSHQ